jgi:molybdenum cofactor cytidylyltransferase
LGKNKYAILILAAGNSRRLGSPKQLVEWKKSTLLNHTIDQARKVDNSDVYVILGSNHNEIRNTITQKVSILVNPDWQKGMGSTITYAMRSIFNFDYEGIILSVCDQPHINNKIYSNLIAASKIENASIVVSKYRTSSGPPTFFSKAHFDALSRLKGENGAKCVVKNNMNNLTYSDFQLGHIDIDTEDDLRKLNNL